MLKNSYWLSHYVQIFVFGVLAGISIGLGALAFVVAKSFGADICAQLAGSALFAVGLLAVCSFGMYLYTGKIGYALDNKPAYLLDLLIGLSGNFIGAAGFGFLCSFNDKFKTGANAIAAVRATESWYISLVLGIVCGILVFIAVDIFKRKPGAVGVLGLILAVMTFVFVGSEHCIANIAYFSMGQAWTWGLAFNVLLVALGNSIGALGFRGLLKLAEYAQPVEKNG